MPNVNDSMLVYRESARGLWNNFLRQDADFDRVDVFASIRSLLFDELVLKSIGKSGFKKTTARDPYPFLLVVPTVDPLPVEINRPSQDHNMYWDYPVESLSTKGLSLQFIDYFDWDDFGYIDFRYFRVKIAACVDHPDVLGREALVEVGYAGVESSDSAASPVA